MNRWFGYIAAATGLLTGCQTLDRPQSNAAPRWMVCANDQRFTQVGGFPHVYENPKAGSLTVMDVSTFPPGSLARVESVPCSLFGPPTCVAVAPNQHYALVASAMTLDPVDSSKQIPDTRLSVVRLMPGPVEIIQQMELGQQPSGVEINRAGTRALVTNRADGSVSLLTLSVDGKVERLKTFSVAAPESSVSHAAFSPDGRRVLITLNKAGKVLFGSLENDELKVLQAIDSGDGPYCVEFTPDGQSAVVGNVYAGSLTVLQIGDREAKAVDTIPIGILAEGLDISPDGQWMVVNCLENTALKPEDPAYRKTAMIVLLQKQQQTFVVVDSIRTGGIPQAAVFTPDGRHVAVGVNAEQRIRFYRVADGTLRETGVAITCSGGPAAMRIAP